MSALAAVLLIVKFEDVQGIEQIRLPVLVLHLQLKLPSKGLPAGTNGTIVFVHSGHESAYEVEFFNDDGETLAVVIIEDYILEPRGS